MSLNRRVVPALARAALQTSRHATHRPQSLSAGRMGATLQPMIKPSSIGLRFHSTPSDKPKVYDFETIQTLSSQPSDQKILIDVREPPEYAAGYIPTAINIPISSSPDALFMPSHEFEEKFGFKKPSADQELVFYCKAGVRSSAAAQLAKQVGYTKVGEYRGSWLDWSGRGGRVERD